MYPYVLGVHVLRNTDVFLSKYPKSEKNFLCTLLHLTSFSSFKCNFFFGFSEPISTAEKKEKISKVVHALSLGQEAGEEEKGEKKGEVVEAEGKEEEEGKIKKKKIGFRERRVGIVGKSREKDQLKRTEGRYNGEKYRTSSAYKSRG